MQFDKLADQLLDLPMDSLKMLRTLVQAVFDKALDEPTFVDMYADLCVRLNERSTSWSFVKVCPRIYVVRKPVVKSTHECVMGMTSDLDVYVEGRAA